MAFSSLNPFSLNPRALPRQLGVLRLVALLATFATALQWIVPAGARIILNAGRIYYSAEAHSLWGEVLPWPVLSVPAWLTMATVSIACLAGAAYLALGAEHVRADVPYVLGVVVGLNVLFPIFIAAFEPDPSGSFRTPGADGYLMGWHWLASPLALLVVAGAVVGAVRARRATNRRSQRVAA